MRVNIQKNIYENLYEQVKALKNFSNAQVRQTYGQIGVDIFQGKKKISIITDKSYKKDDKFINSVKSFLGVDKRKYDYNKKDSLYDVMFKYLVNKEQVNSSEIKNMFGEKGLEVMNVFKAMDYVRQVF